MSYQIKVKRQLKKQLQTLPMPVGKRLLERVVDLLQAEYVHTIVTKPKGGQRYCRLRIGRWYLLLLVDDDLNIILLEQLSAKNNLQAKRCDENSSN